MMATKHRTFKDFVDNRGRNLIHEWLNDEVPKKAKAKINNRLLHLEAIKDFRRPDVAPLKGECDGLYEVRVQLSGVQYRPIGKYGPESAEFTLLVGATERGSRFQPSSACRVAFNRWGAIQSEGDHTCDHRYD